MPLLPQTKPEFLFDVVNMKRRRGDADLAEFRDVCRDFGSGVNATIAGAARAMRQWTKGKDRCNAYWSSRFAFLDDLDAVANETFVGEFIAVPATAA